MSYSRRIVDALIEVLKENESLTYTEAYQKIKEKNLYQFTAKDPKAAVNNKLRCHCIGLEFAGASRIKHFKIVGMKGTRNLYALASEEGVSNSQLDDDISSQKRNSDEQLPEEDIERSYKEYVTQLKELILDKIRSCPPGFFEKLVVDLLLSLGYGEDESSGKVTPPSHDEGIDGVIYEDKLGLSKIYIQAKRYKPGNNVGSEDLQKFVGAMQNVQKGVFITTSSFTREAEKYAKSQQQKSLKLIDGELLAELMIRYCIGLEEIKKYTIYKVNEDYFEY